MDPNELAAVARVVQGGMLKPGFSVAELARNRIAAPWSARAMDRVRKAFRLGKNAEVANAEEVYRSLGSEHYEIVDIGRDDGPAPATRYDLVTNIRSASCAQDLEASFATAHALATDRGVMLHIILPKTRTGDVYATASADVIRLAHANGYRLECLYAVSRGRLEALEAGAAPGHRKGMVVVLVKQMWRPFVGFSGREGGAEPRLAPKANDGLWDGLSEPFAYHRREAMLSLSLGVAAIYGYDVDGDVAEFGTETGGTARGLARAITACDVGLAYSVREHRQAPRHLHLFDSFVGLPAVDPSSIDGKSFHVIDQVWREGALKGLSAEELHEQISNYLPADRIEIYPGWFADTVPLLDPARRFALLHVDCDLYSSTMDCLDSLFSRGMVARGAYVFFDDWNCNRADPELGERRAWRELVEKYAIEASDEGSYGIFARRFVVHDYAGCDPVSRDPAA